MIDVDYLDRILKTCKSNQVHSLKTGGLEIVFGAYPDKQSQASGPALDLVDSTQNIADALKKQEESLPIDLRADDLMNADKILNWSSPDAQHDIPLTGDGEL